MTHTAPGSRVAAIGGASFVLLVAAANWLTGQFGMVPLAWGLSVAAGTAAAGLVLLVRDVVHDSAGVAAVFVCIALGGLLSYMTSGPGLAVASAVAFSFAEVCDLLVYSPLRRHGWGRAAFWSGVAGAVVDTVLFLWLAPLPLTGGGVFGQVLVKVGITALVVAGAVSVRAVLRDSVDRVSA